MKVIYKYWKNSNNGDLIMSQSFTETKITGIPTYYYRNKQQIGENLELIGYVEISEKKYKRELKKHVLESNDI